MVYVVVTRYIPPVSADGGMQGWKRQPNFNDAREFARGFGALAVSFMNSPSSPTPPGHRLQPRVTQDFEFLYQAVFYGVLNWFEATGSDKHTAYKKHVLEWWDE